MPIRNFLKFTQSRALVSCWHIFSEGEIFLVFIAPAPWSFIFLSESFGSRSSDTILQVWSRNSASCWCVYMKEEKAYIVTSFKTPHRHRVPSNSLIQGALLKTILSAYQILVFDCVAALIDREESVEGGFQHIRTSRLAEQLGKINRMRKVKFESMTRMKKSWEMFLAWLKKWVLASNSNTFFW